MIESGYKSDKGRKRDRNEDSFIVVSDQNVFGVADGVGGSNAGEIASSTAVKDLAGMLEDMPVTDCENEGSLGEYLKQCVDRINDDVFSKSRSDDARRGMATTLVLCHVRDMKAYTVNVGDSRLYLKRGCQIFQLTEDHTYVQSLVRLGVITGEEAKVHDQGHYITRALGAEPSVEPDYYQTDLENDDILLLCTDGLYNELNEEKINSIIDNNNDMRTLADTLVKEANDAGGGDNITVVCVRVTEGGQDEQ